MTEAEIQELKDQVAKMNERLGEVDNRSRESAEENGRFRTAFSEFTQGITIHEIAIRKLYMGQTSNNLIIDALMRYLAGYKAGDYLAEREKVKTSGKEATIVDMATRDPNFDGERFQAILQEISDYESEQAKIAKAERKASETQILAPNGQPALRVIK